MGALNFNPDEVLAELRMRPEPPAKTANPAKLGIEFSNFSRISRATLARNAGWEEGLAYLAPSEPLAGFPAARWTELIRDGHRFLDQWKETARSLAWTAEDLFGVHPIAPAARYDCMGLVPLIGGGEVIDMKPDRATIRMPSGNCLVYYLRRPNPESVAIWRLP